MPIIYKYFQRIETKKTLPNLFFKANITLIRKSDIFIIIYYKKGRENYRSISLININVKISSKLLVNQI